MLMPVGIHCHSDHNSHSSGRSLRSLDWLFQPCPLSIDFDFDFDVSGSHKRGCVFVAVWGNSRGVHYLHYRATDVAFT
jgi:hypothetical protein